MPKRWIGGAGLILFLAYLAFADTEITVPENPPPAQITRHYAPWAAKQAVHIPPISIDAKAWILLSYPDGDLLSAYEENLELPPASLTKLMTALIVSQKLEDGSIHLSDPVKISVKAWKTGGSKMFIRAGDTISLENLFKGMIIESGNDAAVALAEHISGSAEQFAILMNQTAKSLGLSHSHFQNPNGQPAAGHYSSAKDLSKIAMTLIQKYPDLYKTYSQETFTWSNITQHNRNGLLKIDPSVDGLKTGYTKEAGYCLATSALRKNTRLVAVLLGTKSSKIRTREAKKLIDFGFQYYAYEQVLESDQILQKTAVHYGEKPSVDLGVQEDLWKFLEKSQYENIHLKISFAEHVKAPIHVGDQVGSVEVKLNNEVIKTLPLVAKESIAKGSFFQQSEEWFTRHFL